MIVTDASWAWPWWTALVVINTVNICVCAWLFRQSRLAPDGQTPYLRSMRIMGLIFCLVALYRSVFVSRYLYQYAWFDTLANSSLLIRTLAWAAELSFAGLFALAILRFRRDWPSGNTRGPLYRYEAMAPYLLVGCLLLAQFFATGGLIIKSRLLFAIEETLWSAGFFAILPVALLQWLRAYRQRAPDPGQDYQMLKSFSALCLAWCIGYCTYGLVYHLPTEYWASAFEQLRTGEPEIKTGLTAVREALYTVNVTHRFEDWGMGFVIWHTGYFSVCAWIALFLMRAPRARTAGNSD
jgi:hypothetical protein